MNTLKVKLLTFKGASQNIIEEGKKHFSKLFQIEKFEFVEENPNILYFLSGGSEAQAIDNYNPNNFYCLLASRHHNSYASATEVKTYFNMKGVKSVLLDEEEVETRHFLDKFYDVTNGLNKLKGQNVGLIGQVSEWLIASTIPSDLIKDKLGVNLLQIPWSDLPAYTEMNQSHTFCDYFNRNQSIDLNETSQLDELLKLAVSRYKLNAITVECFPLVQKHAITACLPLAKLNTEGFPAGCEGDISSIVGMMLGKELTGLVPWIANINKITEKVSVFSHCTIAPRLVKNYKITTHFETGQGTAIQGDFISDLVTIYRFDNLFSKMFVTKAEVIGRPKSNTACRTQIEVKLPNSAIKLLKEAPLGNHHLILPGNYIDKLHLACKMLDINVIS